MTCFTEFPMTTTPSPLFRPILDRVALESEDGDQGYFHALLYEYCGNKRDAGFQNVVHS